MRLQGAFGGMVGPRFDRIACASRPCSSSVMTRFNRTVRGSMASVCASWMLS
jgi:hypothetical protein